MKQDFKIFLITFFLIFSPALITTPSIKTTGEEKTINYYDALVEKHLHQIKKDPASYRGLMNLLEIINLSNVSSLTKVNNAIKEALKIKKLYPQARVIAGSFLIQLEAQKGHIKKAKQMVQTHGYITNWLVIGPFDNQGLKGCQRGFGPEMEPAQPFKTNLAYEGYKRPVKWMKAQANPISATLELSNYLYPQKKVCGYAGTYFEINKKRTLTLWLSAAQTLTVWIDGTKVIEDPTYRAEGPFRSGVELTLSPGTHQILIKVCTKGGSWKIKAKFSRKNGDPVNIISSTSGSNFRGKKGEIKHKEAKSFLSEFHDISLEEKDAQRLSDYARLLYLTGSDDLIKHKGQDFALKASEKLKTCRDYITLSLLSRELNRSIEALSKCINAEPENPRGYFHYLLAKKSLLDFSDFVNLINRVSRKFPSDPLITTVKISTLSEAGMTFLAYRKLIELRKKCGDCLYVLDKVAEIAPEAATKQECDRLLKKYVSVNGLNKYARISLVKNFISKGNFKEAEEQIDKLLELYPYAHDVIKFAAGKLVSMNKIQKAEKLLMSLVDQSPHNPDSWRALGSFYNLIGKNELAISTFKKVLELNPQDVEIRRYISKIKPEEKFEKGYVKSIDEINSLLEQFLEDCKSSKNILQCKLSSFDTTTILEQEIDRIYKNGASARFVQIAIRINTHQGAKQKKHLFISYSPTRQALKIVTARVIHPDGNIEEYINRYTIPIVEEEYRLFYDDANEIIEMPPLKPGDIVELKYKLSDTETYSMWENHFGNIVALKGLSAKLYFRFETISDPDIKLYYKYPAKTDFQLNFEKKSDGGKIFHTWTASRIPPIIPEPAMVPLIEISPVIRVSTFKTWEEFGQWWWNLASEQMVVDKQIKEKVKELIEGKNTEDEKIEAIFNWLVRSTRYVGLEFGIHGFKPYRTTEVFSRGFGDCKDKATLMYVMLREAGIDSAIALIRTRNSGMLNADFPFQFYFDHAIVAVPSKNLFLDATVEYLNHNILPPADQGVFGIIVSDEKVKKVTTPISPPEKNVEQVQIEMQLKKNGDAQINGVVSVSGVANSHYRYIYQTTGTRGERLEEELSRIFPGIKLIEQNFSGLDDYSKNVSFTFKASIPSLAMVGKDEMQITALPSFGLFSKYASRSKRNYSVKLGYKRMSIDSYTYKAPEGYVFTTLPNVAIISAKDGSYEMLFNVKKKSPSEINITAIVKINTMRITPDQYEDFRNFCRRVDETANQRIHLKKVKNTSPY